MLVLRYVQNKSSTAFQFYELLTSIHYKMIYKRHIMYPFLFGLKLSFKLYPHVEINNHLQTLIFFKKEGRVDKF